MADDDGNTNVATADPTNQTNPDPTQVDPNAQVDPNLADGGDGGDADDTGGDEGKKAEPKSAPRTAQDVVSAYNVDPSSISHGEYTQFIEPILRRQRQQAEAEQARVKELTELYPSKMTKLADAIEGYLPQEWGDNEKRPIAREIEAVFKEVEETASEAFATEAMVEIEATALQYIGDNQQNRKWLRQQAEQGWGGIVNIGLEIGRAMASQGLDEKLAAEKAKWEKEAGLAKTADAAARDPEQGTTRATRSNPGGGGLTRQQWDGMTLAERAKVTRERPAEVEALK